MEYNRENEWSGGRSDTGPAGDQGRLNPSDGFEGMNYEQRRAHYAPKRQQQAYKHGNEAPPASDHNSDDRNPV